MSDCSDRSNVSRRAVVAGAGSLLAAGLLPGSGVQAEDARSEDKTPPPNAIPPAEALERLKAGNDRYVAGASENTDFSVERIARIDSQSPIAGVLYSAGSPLPPEIIFDQAPGELFVSSNAGNVVSTYELATFEFAVTSFGIPLIFVMGLSNSSAVLTALGATVQRKELPGNQQELVKEMSPAVIAAHGRHASDPLAETIKQNVRLGMKRLKKESEIIGNAVLAGKLKIAGGVYDSKTGRVNLL
ncbi:MAG: carbonic anhydrase [Methyloceanibacter sp.]|nr:carbonic anhydrase [Methyloceanibacter sp.]